MALISSDLPRENSATKATITLSARTCSSSLRSRSSTEASSRSRSLSHCTSNFSRKANSRRQVPCWSNFSLNEFPKLPPCWSHPGNIALLGRRQPARFKLKRQYSSEHTQRTEQSTAQSRPNASDKPDNKSWHVAPAESTSPAYCTPYRPDRRGRRPWLLTGSNQFYHRRQKNRAKYCHPAEPP